MILLAHSGHGIFGGRSLGSGRDAGASGVPADEYAEDQSESQSAKPDTAGGGPAVVLEIRHAFLTCLYSWRQLEVHLLQEQETQLHDLAGKTGRGTDELVQEAVAKLLSHSDWFKQQVQIGADQIARGEFVEEDEMDARIERMRQP